MDRKAVNLRGIAGSAGNLMQGIGGFVFGNENSSSKEDSYVERYLERISNGVIAGDRRDAMTELQSLVAESRSAQMAFGAMGFPVLLTVLRNDRGDVELVRGALETLVSALTPIETSNGPRSEVQPASMNSDLLSRETDNISLLVNLLSEDDFYVRYYTIQLLTALITHSPKRLQEAMLLIPRGITLLMDMLMDREVIRNEALLLLTYLTRKAEEIQKILVFEGAFDKIFSIIKEEGGSDGGVVVQDCLELLNNLICSNASNQVLMRETIGFDPLVSILKLRRGSVYNFTQQKTVNLLNALQTVEILLMGGAAGESAKDNNKSLNQLSLAQKNVMDHLLLFGVESQWAPVAVRCLALRCIGNLVLRNQQNLDALASKQVGEEPHMEPALNAIFRILTHAATLQEFVSADYLFKCFCENNPDGQALLASTMAGADQLSHVNISTSPNLPFGSMLLQVLQSADVDGDMEACCRAALVLSHILKDNVQLKERILKIEVEVPAPSLGRSEPLLHRIVKYLSFTASATKNINSENSESDDRYIQLIILYLLVIWLDCPAAVSCFLESPAHLSFIIDLASRQHEDPSSRGLASFVLGACVMHNNNNDKGQDAFTVVDAVSQKIGLTSYFQNLDDLQKSYALHLAAAQKNRKPLTRSSAASMSDFEDSEAVEISKMDRHPILLEIFDMQFVSFLGKQEAEIKERVMEIFSRTKSAVTVLPFELDRQQGETDEAYINRLRDFVVKQGKEMQELLGRNATLAENQSRIGSNIDSSLNASSGRERVQSDALRKELEELSRRAEALRAEKMKLEAEAINYTNLAAKLESDLKTLSDGYDSLEQANYQLNAELKNLQKGGSAPVDVEAIRAAAKEEAEKESEAELNDLLVCLGQEQTKVEKLSARLAELGEDVDSLLQGIVPDDEEE